MPDINLEGVTTLTFDCYGTLIDWRGGARAAIAELPSLVGADPDRLVDDWLAADRELIVRAYRPYSEILAEALTWAADRQGVALPPEEAQRFAASQAYWPPFPESAETLARLGSRYELAILSNVENAVLASSMALLGGGFVGSVTAEDVRAYKPSPALFEEALSRFALAHSNVLHVAQSLWHDLATAHTLGFRTVWVNREDEPPPLDFAPEMTVPDLARLTDRILF